MNLYFHITKTGNLFHFISNLTSWHFSVRPSYKKYWIENTGELTEQDNEWLAKADNLFKKYTFGEKHWGLVFLRRPENDVWETAIRDFGETDTERFRKIAEYFTPRFEKIWEEEEGLLGDWRDFLKESKSEYIKKDLILDLNTLFNTKPDFSNPLKIVLLMCSSTTNGGGGANIGMGAVTLEVSRMKKEQVKSVWTIFWHEISHVYWEKTNNYMNMLNNFLDKLEDKPSLGDISFKILVKEAVLEAFIPSGVLAEKYFNMSVQEIKSKDKTMYAWRVYSCYNLKDLATKYLEENRKLDEKFLSETASLLLRFLNK